MVGRRRRRGNERERQTTVGPFQLPTARLNLLTANQVQQIHEASLAILAHTGVVFDSPSALAHFRQAGARLEGQRVFLDRTLIEAALAAAPPSYTLHARNPAYTITIDRDHCAVMPGGGPPYVLDLDGRRRPGTLADVENFARLSAHAPNIHVMTRKPVEAQDLDPAVRHLACWRAILTLTDKPVQSGFPGGQAEAEDALQMLALVNGGEAALVDRPLAHCSVNANSPLRFDRAMLESLITFAGYGQPVLVSSFVMAGVTGPATLAGTVAQHNAEVLAGLVLTQLVRPGTPFLYGTATSNADLRNAAPAIGSPESALSIAACAQLARFYGLPCRGGGALTDAPQPDAQSHYERTFTLLTSFLSGINYLMHGLGILESYLTISYTQFALDLELLSMVRHFLQPLEVSDDTLALETIAAVGPGGHFLDAEHTLQRFRSVHFLPHISLRQPFEQWLAEGGTDPLTRANQRCRDLLADYQKPAIASDIEAALDDFVRQRTVAILSAA
ncbi:MAG: trimethylamine methyltransferase family protein [Candidatus Promineifilaceae bacterium]|nr:trimethylamine methyltransferase family protein [Candidatus Promineifilaceae bacterium]